MRLESAAHPYDRIGARCVPMRWNGSMRRWDWSIVHVVRFSFPLRYFCLTRERAGDDAAACCRLPPFGHPSLAGGGRVHRLAFLHFVRSTRLHLPRNTPLRSRANEIEWRLRNALPWSVSCTGPSFGQLSLPSVLSCWRLPLRSGRRCRRRGRFDCARPRPSVKHAHIPRRTALHGRKTANRR